MMKFIKGFWDYRFLLNELVKKGIRLKYRRSYLGILWSLVEPIMTTCVLVYVFSGLISHKGATHPEFPLYIVIGRLLYNFFSNGTKGALVAIRKNAGMIKKVYVPKYLYPLSSVLFNFIIFLISFIVVIPVYIYVNMHAMVHITWRVIYVIPAILILLVLTIGVGLILCTLNVFFRDIEYLWNVGLMIIMYMSAIFYYANETFKGGKGILVKLNPLYQIITMARNAIIGGNLHINGILYTIVVSIASLVIGLVIFRKNQDKFILHI